MLLIEKTHLNTLKLAHMFAKQEIDSMLLAAKTTDHVEHKL